MRAQTLRQKELIMAEKYNIFGNYNKKKIMINHRFEASMNILRRSDLPTGTASSIR